MAFNYNGNEPKKILYNGNNVAKFDYNNTTVWKGLPSEYERLLYIESTGEQYIDTGVGKKDAYGYEIEFKSTGIVKKYSYYNLDGIFGSNGIDSYDTKLWFSYNRNDDTGRNSVQIRSQSFSIDYIALETYYNKHKVLIYNHEIYYDNNNIGTYNDASFSSNQTLYLFAMHGNGTAADFHSKTQVYYLKIYDKDNGLLRDFIPCYRKSDNKPRFI